MYFFGWGFFALGHDDALERKLAGQLPNSRALPEVGRGTLPRNEPLPAMLQQPEGHVRRSSSSSPNQDEAVAGNDEVVAINIETCTEEISGNAVDAQNPEQHGGRDGNSRWAGLKQQVLRLLVSPNIIAVTIGVAIAMVAPLQRMLFVNPRALLRPLGAALEVRCALTSRCCK